MSTELERHVSQGTSLSEQMKFAETLAAASLLPKAYQRQPANVLLAMQLGDALGIPPIQAITGIHVIEGKPSASADLIASLVRRAGHKLRVIMGNDSDGPTATAQLIRADDPDFTFEAVWNTAKAKQAGLLGKGNWKTYPDQMMRNRAVTEVCRQGAGDALYGVIYDPEELGGGTSHTVTQVVEDGIKKAADQAGVAYGGERLGADGLKAKLAAAPEPAPEPEPVVTQADIDEATTVEELRILWQAASPNLRPVIEAKVTDIQAAERDSAWLAGFDANTGEIHDAEIITEETPA